MNTAPFHWQVATDAEASDILARERIEFVHAGVFDAEGVFREKRLPVAQAQQYLAAGWSVIDALAYWGPNDSTRADRPYNSAACRFDVTSLRRYPFEPNAALIVADYSDAHAALAPRSVLATQIARARRLGLIPFGATEFEFILLDETPASITAKGYDALLTHAQENRCWSGVYPASGAGFLRDYDACLRAGDIPLHHLCSELGPGCLEASLPVRPLGTAADDAALFKMYTKAFSIQHHLTAAFMAQLSDAHPGLGGHPILSLRTADGAAVFHDAKDPQGISATCRYFIGGVLRALPELMPMFASTINAYRRYAPGNWAPRTATWGIGNYTCGLRVVAGAADDTRVEFRLPGADTIPHLAFAMMLGAGLTGIEQRLEPPAETRDVGRELVHPEIGPLPRQLLEAAERMQRSSYARELFGAAFVDHFTQNCIHEDIVMRRHVSAFERKRYLHHV